MRVPTFLFTFTLLLLTACGEDKPSEPIIVADFTLSALLDGEVWSADPSAQEPARNHQPGFYEFEGVATVKDLEGKMEFRLWGIAGPGSYPLGTGPGVSGGMVTYRDSSGDWHTHLTGETGVVHLTTVNKDRITGTFSFLAQPRARNLEPRSAVRGQFDLPVVSPHEVGPVPERDRNKISAIVDDERWIGATVATETTPEGHVKWTAHDRRWSISLALPPLLDPQTLRFAPNSLPVELCVQRFVEWDAPHCWTSTEGQISGHVLVLDITRNRMKGSFAFVLPPVSEGETSGEEVVVTRGTFDVGY